MKNVRTVHREKWLLAFNHMHVFPKVALFDNTHTCVNVNNHFSLCIILIVTSCRVYKWKKSWLLYYSKPPRRHWYGRPDHCKPAAKANWNGMKELHPTKSSKIFTEISCGHCLSALLSLKLSLRLRVEMNDCKTSTVAALVLHIPGVKKKCGIMVSWTRWPVSVDHPCTRTIWRSRCPLALPFCACAAATDTPPSIQ